MKYKPAIAMLFFLFVTQHSFAQDVLPEQKKKKISFPIEHSIGFGVTNAITFPEKIYGTGRIEMVPFPKYAFEFYVRYGVLFNNILGIEAENFMGGFQTGTWERLKEPLYPNAAVPADFAEFFPNKISSMGTINIGSNIRVFRKQKLNDVLDIQPYAGMKLFFVLEGYTEGYRAYWTANQTGEKIYHYYKLAPSNRKQLLVPDLQAGFDFLIHPTKNRHNLVLGCYINLGFVKRLSGNYDYYNLGKENDSSGNISYTSSYFGVKIGYLVTKTRGDGTAKKTISKPPDF